MQEQEIQVIPEQFVVNVNKDYNDLVNKPSINDVTLEGNKTLDELNIQAKDAYDTEIAKLEVKDTDLDTRTSSLETRMTSNESKDNDQEARLTTVENTYITKNVSDLANYQTTETVNELLGKKADKTSIPKNVSDLVNDTGFITKKDVPTSVSELHNDTGFITQAEIPTKVSAFENDSNYAKVEQVPTKTSDIENDNEFITKLVEDLVNYYKKTDVYTKLEVNNLIDALNSVSIKKVDALSDTGEKSTIYFVNTSKPSEDNYYDEYMYFEDRWEKIGTTKVDFSDYTDNDSLKEMLANYITNETFQTELAKKLDKTSSGYIKKLSIEDNTIIYTRGDDSTGELAIQDTKYPEATSTQAGLMSATDKSKLDTLNIPTNVSELVNDSEFVTSSQIEKTIQPKLDELEKKMPSKVTDLTNDMLVKCDNENDARVQSKEDQKHVYYVAEEEPVPLVPIDEVYQIPQGETGNKQIEDIEEVEIVDGKLTGTLKYIQDYQINGQTLGGHVLVLHIDKEKLPSGNIRVGIDKTTTLDENDNVYLRVTEQNKTDFVKLSVNSRTLYALDISSLTLEEETLTINAPTEAVLGKEITELQNDISIVEDKVTGSLNYVYGFDMFSAGFEGYFLALEIPEAKGGCEVTFELSQAEYKNKGTIDLDGILVVKLHSINQKLTLKNGSVTKTLDLTGLTFETKIVDFATGTIGELEAMLNAHYDGTLNISDHWHVGDKRTIHLNKIEAEEGGEEQEEKDVEFVIICVDHDDLATQIGDRTKAAITLHCNEIIGKGYYWGSDVSEQTKTWPNNPRRDWLNNTFIYALPGGILNMLKAVNKKNLANHTDATAGTTTQDKAFFLSMTELGSTLEKYKGSDELEGAKYEYFSDDTKKTRSGNNWWLRSPGTSGFCYIQNDGTPNCISSQNTLGIAPAICL